MIHTWERRRTRLAGQNIHMGGNEDEMARECYYTHGRGGRGMVHTWDRRRTRWAERVIHMGERWAGHIIYM